MKLYELFDDRGSFRSIEDVKATIKTSKNYKNESIETAKFLNFFSTSKQKSYLLVTDKMVYCIVDDVRKKQPKVSWSENKIKFAEHDISTSDKTDKTGFINFGEKHKKWLFTKSIFASVKLESKINEILS